MFQLSRQFRVFFHPVEGPVAVSWSHINEHSTTTTVFNCTTWAPGSKEIRMQRRLFSTKYSTMDIGGQFTIGCSQSKYFIWFKISIVEVVEKLN